MNEPVVYAIRRSANIITEYFDDEIVVANLTAGMYYSLRFTAADLWKLLEAGATMAQLKSALSEAFEVEGIDLQEHVSEFIQQLATQELIIQSQQKSVEFTLPTVEIKNPYVKPELVVFDDMQDLLALDPIHDVDEKEGWPVKKQL